MPLHEYECDACGHRFERIQKFSDPPVEVCPKCAGPVHKLISSPAFQFKGTGWYITDYAKKDSSGHGKGSGESKEGGGKDGGGQDAKDSGTSSPDTKSSESKASESKGSENKSGGKAESSSSSSSSDSSSAPAKPKT